MSRRVHSLSQTRRMARTAGLVMILILASRVLGLVREVVIAQVFGMSWETDVFRNAFNLPDLMYFLLVGGGLNAAFIPVFTSHLAKDEEDEAWKVASTFFTVTVSLLLVMAVVGIILTPYLTPLVGYGFTGQSRELLVQLMRILFGAVFFTALAGLGMGVHKSYKSFTAPMVGPIVYNIAIILGAYTLARYMGIFSMAVGTVIGAVGNFLVQLPFFLRKSAGRFRIRFDLRHPSFLRILRLMGPSVLALSIFQVSFMISANLASGLAEGSASALRIGQQLVQLPLGIFAMGMGTVLLPTLSELAAKREIDTFKRTFASGLRAVLFITIPAAFGLAVLAVPVIRLLFESGQFTAADTQMSAVAVRFYAVGLFAQASSQILMQVFSALQDTKTLVRVSVVSIIVNTVLSLVLLRVTSLGHGALALAWSITVILNMINYLLRLRQHVGDLTASGILKSGGLSIAASVIMGIGAYSAAQLVSTYVDVQTMSGRLVQVGTGVVVGAGIYAAITTLLRMEEVRFVLSMVRRGSKRGPTSPS